MVRHLFLQGSPLHGRRNPFVAQEGLPLLVLMLAIAVLLIRYSDPLYAFWPLIVFALLVLVFRDPQRNVPSVALGVFSPVDGKVLEIDTLEAGDTGEPVFRVVLSVDSFGTYTARSPVEGLIRDLGQSAMWLQTDEGVNVTLKFRKYRLGLAPQSFARFGERLGQGQRCAYLRLAGIAEVQWPSNGKVEVEVGQAVKAGSDVLGTVQNPR